MYTPHVVAFSCNSCYNCCFVPRTSS